MTLATDLLKMQDELFISVAKGRVPPFPGPISGCNALNATPFLVSMDRFVDLYGTSSR